MNRRFSKWEIFFASVAIGLGVMSFRFYEYGFNFDGVHAWLLDGAFVTAIVGWVALKAAKHFGRLKE